MTKEEWKTLIFVVLITIIGFGFLIWFYPHTSMYKEAQELARYNDFKKASFYSSPLRNPNIPQAEYDEWFDKFETKWNVSRESFESSVIIKKAMWYFDDEN